MRAPRSASCVRISPVNLHANLTGNLVDQFERVATLAAASVERIAPSAAALAQAVQRVAANAASICVAEPADLPVHLFSECRRLPNLVAGRTKAQLAACDVGVTDAFAGVATTGSLCLRVGNSYGVYASLLPRLHVAVLDARDIVARPGDLFREDCLGGKGLRESFVYVTGPSATADMGELVRGVHGPHRLHIVIVEEP